MPNRYSSEATAGAGAARPPSRPAVTAAAASALRTLLIVSPQVGGAYVVLVAWEAAAVKIICSSGGCATVRAGQGRGVGERFSCDRPYRPDLSRGLLMSGIAPGETMNSLKGARHESSFCQGRAGRRARIRCADGSHL